MTTKLVNAAPTKNKDSDATLAASKWIKEADAVLICAGAGMSSLDGQNVYTNPKDFQKWHPMFARKYGYTGCWSPPSPYDGFPSVPSNADTAFWADHSYQMAYVYQPNEGFTALLDMCKDKKHFVQTSNVDSMFQKAGFAPEKVWTPQGEFKFLQCGRRSPCTLERFDGKPVFEKILSSMKKNLAGEYDYDTCQYTEFGKCPYCKSGLTMNLRGGSNMVHEPYMPELEGLVQFVEGVKARGEKLAVIEVGAGFNTPVVTRFPMESIVRELEGHGASLIRINPTHPDVPSDLERAVGISEGWQLLLPLRDSVASGDARAVDDAERRVLAARQKAAIAFKASGKMEVWQQFKLRNGHFDWRGFFAGLLDEAQRPGAKYTGGSSAKGKVYSRELQQAAGMNLD